MENAEEMKNDVVDHVETPDAQKMPEKWNYNALFTTMVVMFFVQAMTLNCLCYEGSVKTELAMMFDLCVLIRIIFAMALKERGNTWKFYMWLVIASPFWITILVMMFK